MWHQQKTRLPLKHDFRTDTGCWVHMTAHRFECAINTELAGTGITYRQCQILGMLALQGEGGLSQGDLAKLMNVEPSTIVKVLDRMERDGLVERQSCPEDRRKRIIEPTAAAVPIWKKIMACAAKVRQQAEQGLSPAELEQLRSLLERVHDNLGGSQDCTLKQLPQPSFPSTTSKPSRSR